MLTFQVVSIKDTKKRSRSACFADHIFDGKKELRASIVFANLKPGQTQILSGCRWIWGCSVYVSALRLDNGELLIVVSADSSQTAISDYRKRWGIETAEGGRRQALDLKSRACLRLYARMFKTLRILSPNS